MARRKRKKPNKKAPLPASPSPVSPSAGSKAEAAADAGQGHVPAWWRPWLPALAALLITIGYAIAAAPNAFIYDDVEVILVQQPPESLGDVAGYFAERHFPGLAYYRPVTRATLLVQKALHGNDPFPFHAFNALLAGLLCLVTYGVLRQPRLASGRQISRVPSLAAAMLFALHPVASSCVYPAASGRETLLPAVFAVCTLYAFLRSGWLWSALTVVAFAGALFGKEQMVVLPALLLLAELLKLHEPHASSTWFHRAARYGGMALVVIVYFTARQALFGGQEFELAVLERPWVPPLSYVYALQALIVPFWQLNYEPPLAVWVSPLRLTLAAALLVVLLRGLWRRREDLGKLTLFAAAWFILTQLATANLLVQEAPFSERYIFLAAFGLLAPAAALLSRQVSWTGTASHRRTALLGVLVVLAAATSFHRGVHFRDPLAFHSQWARSNPVSEIAHQGRAQALARAGRTDEALAAYTEALRIHPEYAEAHLGLGNLLLEQGRIQEAEASLRRAALLAPNLVAPRAALGDLLRQRGAWQEALVLYDEALELEPEEAQLHLRRGLSLETGHRPAEALAAFRRAVELGPNMAQAYFNLGTSLLGTGDDAAAVTALRRAVGLQPDLAEAHVNLGAALSASGNDEAALASYAEGLRLDPNNAAAQLSYGVALLTRGRAGEAVQHLRNGVTLQPRDPRARVMLAQALLQSGETRGGGAELELALQLARQQGPPELIEGIEQQLEALTGE